MRFKDKDTYNKYHKKDNVNRCLLVIYIVVLPYHGFSISLTVNPRPFAILCSDKYEGFLSPRSTIPI